MLIIDGDGRVAGHNAAAAAVLPELRPGTAAAGTVPPWLTEPMAGAEVRGRIGERLFAAHPTTLENGSTAWWLVDDTAYRLAVDELAVERERARFLIESSNALLSTLDPERCMEVAARLAAQHLADAAVVIAPAAGRLLPMALCARGGQVERRSIAVDPVRVPGLEEALRGFPPVPARWMDPAAAPEWLVPEGCGAVGSVAVTPLPGHAAPAGALVLLRTGDRAGFSDSEDEFAALFAARVGAAMSAARLYAEQSSITDVLMRDLLPPRLRQVEGVELASGYRPAGDAARVGGDFYDIHPTEDAGTATRALVALGDVCGKGLEAAVITGKIRNTLHALLPMADDHQRMLSMLNRALVTSDHTRFATLVLASIARIGPQLCLQLTSAGHPAPLIVRRDGGVEEVETRGSLVGVLPAVRSTTAHTTLAPGETCLLFTDGIPDARGGPTGDELFGVARLERALAECAGMPAEGVVERVRQLAVEWVGEGKHDDMALIAITAPRGAHLTAVDGTTAGRYTA
ncbi:GAF domain-containing SpoIIE family protein phosphatase [Streptomyces sp. NPDC048636]|uniref:PP2C family protein-serine/threonine phosphatase n=1 Tax=Streptomyces sp. NPDC048636 TaxID=3155762 RepID=UPI00343C2700